MWVSIRLFLCLTVSDGWVCSVFLMRLVSCVLFLEIDLMFMSEVVRVVVLTLRFNIFVRLRDVWLGLVV